MLYTLHTCPGVRSVYAVSLFVLFSALTNDQAMSYPLLKSALLLASAATFFYGMKPPTPRVAQKQVVYLCGPSPALMRVIASTCALLSCSHPAPN